MNETHRESEGTPNTAPDAVQRWEDSGGTWKVDVLGADLVRILLCRCDGGEVVDAIETADSATVAWARAQAS
ncbi:hypothetical protein [Gulosibacter chungangensis]|uniref:Uncharacterized protein n=1 Tax=Gulosibacter chungangensis TaxID=979746 RepID=A0A7J5B9B5_9MICO|nr:hypothetical protein [Gulosibacter chungangensis]KAB1642160.1 hypothetical protein F8O05_10060 [Gulosibacter chungangensis]